jgi:transcriptional regulator with XRE-family HTH domain
MSSGSEKLRKILSANIKTRRKSLGISQEKLAEATELSAQTINDIEGCRMWVSDKSIVKLAVALNVEAYQLLIPNIEIEIEGALPPPSPAETLVALRQSIKKNIDEQFASVLARGV